MGWGGYEAANVGSSERESAMDWKDVLRRRLASPNTNPKSEFGRDRPLDSPPQARSGGQGEWEEEEVRAVLSASVLLL